jgi:hypothetical protein
MHKWALQSFWVQLSENIFDWEICTMIWADETLILKHVVWSRVIFMFTFRFHGNDIATKVTNIGRKTVQFKLSAWIYKLYA